MTEVTNTPTPILSNTPRALTIGRQAGRDWLTADKHAEGGDARATFAMFLALNDCIRFTAVIPGKDGDVGESHTFDLEAFGVEPKRKDGKRDSTLVSARYTAIAQEMFGLSEADNAIVQRIRRAYNMAVYISAQLDTLSEEDADKALPLVDLVTRKRARHGETVQIAFLTVPQFILFNEMDKTLKLNDQQRERLTAMRLFPVELDGSSMPGVPVRQSLRAISARADTAGGRGKRGNGGSDDASKANATFISAVTFLDKLTREYASPEGVPSVDLSKARRVDLFVLQARIASIFAEQPLSDEERAELNRRETKPEQAKKVA
jgi:hypothetical protein